MKLKIFLFLYLAIGYYQLHGQSLTAFDSLVTTFISFSPVNKHPDEIQDSFIVKYRLQVDTVIKNKKKNYYYFRGYTKSYNPFSVSFDSIEITILYGEPPSQLVLENNMKSYYILLSGYSSLANEEIIKIEMNRLKSQIEAVCIPWSQSNSRKKARKNYEAFYFRNDNKSLYPHIGIGRITDTRKGTASLSLRIAYPIHFSKE